MACTGCQAHGAGVFAGPALLWGPQPSGDMPPLKNSDHDFTKGASHLNWLEVHIDTNHAGLEPVEAMLSSLDVARGD